MKEEIRSFDHKMKQFRKIFSFLCFNVIINNVCRRLCAGLTKGQSGTAGRKNGTMMDYDVLIIGAGPGGIFTAYELTSKAREPMKVGVFELGNPLNKRKCPIDGEKVKSCVRCKTCSIMSGFGGAGAFSDGKYNITNDFGGSLHEHVGKSRALELMRYVDEINMKYGGE